MPASPSAFFLEPRQGAAMFKAMLDVAITLTLAALYLLPAIIADRSKRRSVLFLALFNLMFGWTIVGWIAAMYWAYHPDSARQLGRIVRNNKRATARKTVDGVVARSRARAARRSGHTHHARDLQGSSSAD
jgi:hypothetical protein